MLQSATKYLLFVTALFLLCAETSKATLRELNCQGTIDREGSFQYLEYGPVDPERMCLSLIKAPVNYKVELRVQPLSVPCGDRAEIAYVDGLNLNNDFFPGLSEDGPPMSERMQVLCSESSTSSYRFMANQNVASILFRFSAKKSGFRLNVRFVRNPTPCNMITPSPNATGEVVLSNYGARRNCSLLVLYPTEFYILKSDLAGGESLCPKGKDFYEIRSGFSVDPLLQTFSAVDSCTLTAAELLSEFNGPISRVSPCFASIVRLVSSGNYNNKLLIRHRPMDLELAGQQCPMK